LVLSVQLESIPKNILSIVSSEEEEDQIRKILLTEVFEFHKNGQQFCFVNQQKHFLSERSAHINNNTNFEKTYFDIQINNFFKV
jgi:hypothetical protein